MGRGVLNIGRSLTILVENQFREEEAIDIINQIFTDNKMEMETNDVIILADNSDLSPLIYHINKDKQIILIK